MRKGQGKLAFVAWICYREMGVGLRLGAVHRPKGGANFLHMYQGLNVKQNLNVLFVAYPGLSQG